MADLPRPGSTFAGKYVIESELGRGTAGVVLCALHLGLRQQVAIKVLREAGGVAAERMTREARATVSLHSEHVVRVMDVGRDGGHVFLVMEKLDGVDLGTLLKQRGPLPVAEAVDHVLHACAGVAEAHARGIVHRDLKPSNLFLTRRSDGSPLVKVLDFGISKFDQAGDGEASLTGPAEVLGSPMYMAPEQVRGARDVDHRSDIWSLGVILFRLVTGQGPFGSGMTVSSALASVIADEPQRLRALVAGAPRELEGLVLRCLEKKPSDRVPTVGDLARHLAPFGTDEGRAAVARLLSTAAGASPRSRLGRVLLGLVVGSTLATLAVLALTRAPRPSATLAAAPATSAPALLPAPAVPAPFPAPPPSSSSSVASPALGSSAVAPVATSPRPPALRAAPRPRPSPGVSASVIRSAATDDRY